MTEVTVEELRKARSELIRLRAQGIMTLTDQNGESITYKTDSQMASALAALDSEIRRLERGNPTTIAFVTTKGL